MNVGFGYTGLVRGITPGRIDGIGVYTKELQQALLSVAPTCVLKPCLFGNRDGLNQPIALRFSLPYEIGSAITYTTRLSTIGSCDVENAIDIFHATDHFIPRLKKKPVVSTVMDVIPIKHPEMANPKLRNMKNRVFIDAVKSSDHVITISDFSASEIVEYIGIKRNKITVVPLGVNARFFVQTSASQRKSVIEKFGINSGYFLFLGTLQPRKNLARVLEAYQSLPVEVQKKHHLVVVGAARPGMDALEQKLISVGKRSPVTWLQYVDDAELMPIIQSAKALVFTSLYEGFGLPVLEAFASRIPVITSNCTSLPEVAGEAAILVDPLSIDAIGNAMQAIAGDAHMCASLIEKGSSQALQFTWQKTAEKTLDVYNFLAKPQ